MLPWLQSPWQDWIKRIRAGMVAPSLLVSGQEGVGTLPFSRALQSALVCEAHSVQGFVLPCGDCRNCRLMAGGAHPDVLEVTPDEGAAVIRIDQIRAVRDFVYSRPQIARRRVLLLQPADAMNLNAANALLKTLEEPADDARIILVTAHPSRLLATIRSRCQKLPLPLPSRQVGLQWLSEQGLSPEIAATVLEQAHGAPLKALEDARSGQHEQRQQVLDEWRAFLAGTRDAFSLAEEWGKLDAVVLIDWLMSALHHMAVRSIGDLPEPRIHRLYEALAGLMKTVHEKRNLNMALQWEHWLMLCKTRLPMEV